jgi:hypothetical protein
MPTHDIETRLKAIEQRNAEVAQAKAWEVSLTRKLVVASITYACACLTFLFILPQESSEGQWFLAALVPTGGYVLSTLGLPPLKKWWAKRFL